MNSKKKIKKQGIFHPVNALIREDAKFNVKDNRQSNIVYVNN